MAAEKSDMSVAQTTGQVLSVSGRDSASPAAPGGKARLNPANFVLIVLFAGGLGSVYLLSLRSGRPTASAAEKTAEAEVDAALLQLDAVQKQQAEETSAVVDTFYYEASQRQIPLTGLKSNPFVYKPPGATVDSINAKPQVQNLAEIQRRQELEDRMQAVKGLKLQSVLMGSDGAKAMISNNLVKQGQTVNGWTVESIEPRSVVLTWKEHKYVLKLPR